MAAWEFLIKDIHASDEGEVVLVVDDGYVPVSVEEQQGISEALAQGRIYRVVFARRSDDSMQSS